MYTPFVKGDKAGKIKEANKNFAKEHSDYMQHTFPGNSRYLEPCALFVCDCVLKGGWESLKLELQTFLHFWGENCHLRFALWLSMIYVIKWILRQSTDFTLQNTIFTHKVPYLCYWISLLPPIFCSKVGLQGGDRETPAHSQLQDFHEHWWSCLPSPFPSLSTAGLAITFESSSAAGMGAESQVSFTLWRTSRLQSEQGLCHSLCHLLPQRTSVVSPGVKNCPNPGECGPVSSRMGMAFWQGDKRHSFLPLTCWPGA